MGDEGSSGGADGQLLVLILSNGMEAGDMCATIEALKSDSKKIGTHKRRELFWNAYGMMATKVSPMSGEINAFITYRQNKDGEGKVEIIELTKRQRGLVNGGCDIVSRKLKPPEDPTSKKWAVAWSEDDAQEAWDDLMSAEPCIFVTSEAIFVATLYKRVLCKGISAPFKNVKDLEAAIAELKPENPLRSISFAGNHPPSVNAYNVCLAGPSPIAAQLPSTIGHVNATSNADIYACFLKRRNDNVVAEANKLISQMLADVGKELVPLISTGKKDAGKAYLNGLMKKAYVHESMTKFIDRVKADGQVELAIVKGDVPESSSFAQYGMVVFEMYYRCDLSQY